MTLYFHSNNIYKVSLCKCSMKTIKVSEKNWQKLMKWKIDFRCKNLDEIIERILKIVSVSELKEKVEE